MNAKELERIATDLIAQGEHVEARDETTSNTAEAYFAILKRGVYGTFHSISEAHLHRYLSEFDFRWNTRETLGVDDIARAEKLLRGAKGKRLYYRQPGSGEVAA